MDIIGNIFLHYKTLKKWKSFWLYIYPSKSTKFYHQNFLKVQFDSLQNLVRQIFMRLGQFLFYISERVRLLTVHASVDIYYHFEWANKNALNLKLKIFLYSKICISICFESFGFAFVPLECKYCKVWFLLLLVHISIF